MSQNDKMKKLSAKYGSMQYFKNIFPKYIRSKGLVQNTEKATRYARLKSNRTGTEKLLELIPDYYDKSIFFSNKIFNLNKTASGSFATVYLQYYNENNKYKTRKSNIIFKEIKDANGSEYKALIFHYLLEYYYEINDPSKLKYLCILKEVGKIPKAGKIYGIMDYCGKELVTIKDSPLIKESPLKGLDFIINVFRESLIALKLIHDVGYLHMDIKPENYLFNYKDGNYQVKIIDFGMITKCYSSVDGWYGTSLYLPNDWLYNYSKGFPTILDKHHDLFELGCMFIDMIFYLLNNFTYKQNLEMCCPIKNNVYTQDQIIEYRTYYNENQHNADMKFISNLLGVNGLRLNKTINDMIINIIFKMVHPIPSNRFKSIDEILPKVDELIDELLPSPPQKLLNPNIPIKQNIIMSQNDKMKKLSAKYGSMQYFKNIFPQYIRSKGLVPNTKKITRFATLKSNRTHVKKNIELIPDYYNESIFFSNKIFNLNKTASGSFATVYLQYYNRNNKYKTRKSNIIFKEIKDANGSEYKALIFHYLLEYYYEINDPSKLKYLCILKEVGKIPKAGKIYGIMDYCGKELVTIKDSPLIKESPLKGLDFIINVFRESLIALKLIHDVGYLHMDIKPENYLFNYKDGNYQVKIIDFGMITKCYSSVDGWYGTSLYLPNDWLYNYSKGFPTILDKHHDLFELGCMFIDMIFYLLNNFTYKQNLEMCCPIKNNVYTQDQIIEYRTYYNENQHNADMRFISNLLGVNGLRLNKTINDIIISIIFKMVHPIPSKRFKSIDEILPKVDELINILLPSPPQKLLNPNIPIQQNIKFRKVTPEKRNIPIQRVNSPMRYQIPQIPPKPNIPKSPYVYQIQAPKKITPVLNNRKQLHYNQMRLQLKKKNEKLKKKHTPENLGVRAGKFQRYKDAYEKYL